MDFKNHGLLNHELLNRELLNHELLHHELLNQDPLGLKLGVENSGLEFFILVIGDHFNPEIFYPRNHD